MSALSLSQPGTLDLLRPVTLLNRSSLLFSAYRNRSIILSSSLCSPRREHNKRVIYGRARLSRTGLRTVTLPACREVYSPPSSDLPAPLLQGRERNREESEGRVSGGCLSLCRGERVGMVSVIYDGRRYSKGKGRKRGEEEC